MHTCVWGWKEHQQRRNELMEQNSQLRVEIENARATQQFYESKFHSIKQSLEAKDTELRSTEQRKMELQLAAGRAPFFLQSLRSTPTADAEAPCRSEGCLKTRLTGDLCDATPRFDPALGVRRRHAPKCC